MRASPRFALFVLLVAAAAALVPAASSGKGGKPSFGPDVVLPGGQGGEPSIAIDTSPTASRGDIYVGAIGDSNGPLEWHSYDGGKTWSQPVPFDLNGPLRGGDEDVAVNTNGDLIATDLNVSWASVQVSTDQGKTFDDGTQTAPEDDRPWLTAAGQNVYVAYHDFVAEAPVVCTSHDGGHTFLTCVQAFGADPSVTNCAENTVPSRALAIDPTNFSLNFLYSCSTAAENLQHPPYGPLHDYYLAQSTNGGVTWTTHKVFVADSSGGKAPNYANIFGTLAIDSAGNYYTLFAGTADDNNADTNPYHVYLVVSRDHGATWGKPIQVDHDANGAGTHVLPHLAVTSPGNVDVVWYGTTATGEPNGVCGTIVSQSPCTDSSGKADGFPPYTASNAPAWDVYLAQSTNALSSSPTFQQVAANATPTHYGEICSNGLVCGSSDRSLLDFISVAVDCKGFAHITYGGNTKQQEAAGQTFVHVANQTGGSALAPPAACGARR
ncbi:MAG: sialidase family protein [Gaiellaceae bacterium]